MQDTMERPAVTLDALPANDGPIVAVPPAEKVQVLRPAINPLALLEVAMQAQQVDLDRAERLMRMAIEWRQFELQEQDRQAARAFDDDFAKFTALGIVIPKTKLVKQRAKSGGAGPTFWQSEFDVASKLLKPALGGLGFGVSFDPEYERQGKQVVWCKVKCTLSHRLGHSRSLTLEGPPDDSGSKNQLQEAQSSSTYLMRHSLLAITGTAQEGKDNDGRGARGYREDGDDAFPPDGAGDGDATLQALLNAGHAAAEQGMPALNDWWGGLTDAQRTQANPYFLPMRKKARALGGAK